MALTRVQAAPKTTGGSTTSIAITFSAPPTIGNGIVVLIVGYAGPATHAATTCVDNQGHSYTLAAALKHAASTPAVLVFYCPRLTATGAPFTITVTTTTGMYWVTTAVEVSGVGTGLQVDQALAVEGIPPISASFSTGPTGALTAAEVFAVSVVALGQGQSSLTVEAVSPSWTQEVEDLTFTWSVGEADSRVLTGVAGTTQSCSWTGAPSTTWVVALACFRAPILAVTERVDTYLLLPV